jgi:hypothetical protein
MIHKTDKMGGRSHFNPEENWKKHEEDAGESVLRNEREIVIDRVLQEQINN